MAKDYILVCLGSGLAPRYRKNTLQGLALPVGGHLQFRYTTDIISEDLHERLARRKLLGAKVLLGYVDCTEKGRSSGSQCPVVPYRQATLLDSRKLGSIFVLHFELGGFVSASDSDVRQLYRTLPKLPKWKLTVDNQPDFDQRGQPQFEGYWCQQIAAEHCPGKLTESIEGWQTIVEILRSHGDFSAQPYFYMVDGLFRQTVGVRNGKRIPMVDGEYQVKGAFSYTFRILHYDPDSTAHTGHKKVTTLKLDMSSPMLAPHSSPVLVIDSPYDLKSIHFGTDDAIRSQYGSIYLSPGGEAPELQVVPDLYIPVLIRGSIRTRVTSGLIVGLLLAATQLIVLLGKGPFDGWKTVAILVACSSVITGVFVSMGMRKPL
jgi:hypothetical protein